MEYAINKGSLFAPGSKYKYSNTNYAILGEIITREVGYSYKQYLEEKIFIPLNLENTFNNLDEADYDEVMGGYIYDYEPNIKEVSHYSPGGSMVISVSDVVKFINALRGDFLNENAKAIYESVYTYDHTGLLPGYQSIARYDEASETLIVLFTNTTGQYSWGYIEDLYTKILKINNK
jgi:CubicO group peptidase (beta-lactamase class C family)